LLLQVLIRKQQWWSAPWLTTFDSHKSIVHANRAKRITMSQETLSCCNSWSESNSSDLLDGWQHSLAMNRL
jgi:hypothetical protein